MNYNNLQNLSNYDLLELYEAFIKMWHYEATDEFNNLRELNVNYEDVRKEILSRFKYTN